MKNKEIKRIENRINRLNAVIDNKIINGQPYNKEAREHLNLWSYLKDLKLNRA